MKGRFGVDWFELQKTMVMASVVVFAVSMCLSVNVIMLGFHNLDLGHNMLRLNELWILRFNTTLSDVGSDMKGNIDTAGASELIFIGVAQLRNGWTSLMVTAIMFGVSAASLRYMKEVVDV